MRALVIALLAVALGMAGEGWAKVQGIYSLWSPDQQVLGSAKDLDQDFVSGLSLRATWSKLESRPGSYDWSRVDAGLGEAMKRGKPVILRVVASNRSPAWVFASTEVVPGYMPLPWDRAYLNWWTNFIRVLGDKYANHPNIVAIQMAGGGEGGEMILNSSYDWDEYGYNSAKLVAVWKQIIDAYAKNFPKQMLGLDINFTLPWDRETVYAVVDYCTQHYPGRVMFQNNGLNGRSLGLNKMERLLLSLASSGNTVGFQTTGSLTFREDYMGDYSIAFQKAVNAGASYLEVYRYDILAPELESSLKWLASNLHQEEVSLFLVP
ncbi:MAG: hypothetical protein PHX53_00035 [Syntrophales bacterium]|nr:hypothetical protein [Syntrophales bacterium]